MTAGAVAQQLGRNRGAVAARWHRHNERSDMHDRLRGDTPNVNGYIASLPSVLEVKFEKMNCFEILESDVIDKANQV